jgi:hypothetical protein
VCVCGSRPGWRASWLTMVIELITRMSGLSGTQPLLHPCTKRPTVGLARLLSRFSCPWFRVAGGKQTPSRDASDARLLDLDHPACVPSERFLGPRLAVKLVGRPPPRQSERTYSTEE